jgi:MFS family permease
VRSGRRTFGTEVSAATLDVVSVQRRVVGVLSSSQVLSGIAYSGTTAAGGLLVVEITGSEGLAGLSQTTGILGAAVFALPLARMALTSGRRRSLSSGYAIGAAGAVLVIAGALLRNVLLILLGSLLVGAANATGFQARYAATDLAPAGKRGRALSYVVWATTVGGVLGPNLLGVSGSLGQKVGLPLLAGPYVITLVCLIGASAVIALLLRPDPFVVARDLRSAVDVTAAAEAARPRLRDGLTHLKRNPRAMLGVATIAAGHLVMVGVMVMTPVHMRHVDVSLQFIGLVISVHVAGMYALSPLVGLAVDRLGRMAVLYFGVVILLASCVISGLAPADSVPVLGLGLFLLGLGWSCTLIAGSVLVTDSTEEVERPAVQGLSDLIMNLAGALGGVAAGLIVLFGSYGLLCAASAIPVVALAVVAALPACRRDSYTRSG